VAERRAFVEGRSGDVRVRPRDPVRHELPEEQPGHRASAQATTAATTAAAPDMSRFMISWRRFGFSQMPPES
jgi:hypothetical protein